VGLVNLIDGVGKLSPAPIFFSMDPSLGALNHGPITLHHGGDILTLVRMDQKHNFIVSQLKLLSD
jgi:hypothetical protein